MRQQGVCSCVVLAALLSELPAVSTAGSVVAKSQHWLDAGPPQESIQLSTTTAARTVPAHFLSYTHDAYFMVADLGIQPVWNDSSLLNMVGALAPSMIRVGGGDMDYTEMNFPAPGNSSAHQTHPGADLGPCPPDTASPSGYLQLCGEQCPKNCVMNSTTWGPFLSFANHVDAHVVAGLNALDGRLGNASRPWNGSRAKNFLHWADTHYKSTIVAVELGNEPRAFGSGPPGVAKGKATHLLPEQLAADVAGPLRSILRELDGDIALWGPDVDSPTNPEGFFQRFLEGLHVNKTLPPLLQAATYHQYYNEENRGLTTRSFTDVRVLDSIVAPLQKMVSIVKEISPAIRVIMGETSSVAGEGAGTASDTFAAIFMFLDKLALAAVTGHDAVFHQTILDPTMNEAGQHEVSYEAIKEGIPNVTSASWTMKHGSYSPTPNYWASLLWKALMGTTVLDVANSTDTGRSARVYAHCTTSTNTTAATRLIPGYSSGAVTVMVLNVRETAASLLLPSSLCVDANCSRDEYHLSSGQAAPVVLHNCTVPVPPCCHSGSCPCTANFAVVQSTSAVHDQALPSRAVDGTTTSGNRISFLGNFSNWTACMDNARQRYWPYASSFTWFDRSSATNALACFAHRDGVWKPSADPHAVSGKSPSWQPSSKPCESPPNPAQTTLSVEAKLNNRLLALHDSSHVPQLGPRRGHGKRVTVQPFTAAWFVFEAHAKACLK
jgi:heparanase 1